MKQPKPRKCKAKGCTNTFIQRNSFEVVCSLTCAINEGKRKEEMKREKELRLQRQLEQVRFKELKDLHQRKHKKLSEYESEAKKAFQKWVRLRDKDLPCISCGATTSKPCWDGGHYKKAEKYSGVIFNEFNCNKQCRKCNFYEDGNEANYRAGLVKKIGAKNVELLETLADKTRMYKYSRDELIGIRKHYEEEIKKFDF